MVPLRRSHYLFLALALLVGATRFLALSKSLWDWDEGLFVAALRDYDVADHHPHPPGFPLFVAAAKLVRVVVPDDFLALRTVTLIAALCAFPAMVALGRALGMPLRTSIIAGLLFAFLPSVWYWGGTAFSDVFAVVCFVAAAACLFRRDRYLLGSILFAGALLVRPQNLLLIWPWALATWRKLRERSLRDVAVSAALITVLVLGGYLLAARATGGWARYIKATRLHQKYVATVDGMLNPNRPKPMLVFRDFFIDPFLGGKASTLLFVFALCAFLRPKRRHADILLTFVPNLILAWLMLSVTGVSRLSLGYLPMHALLAADGIAALASFLPWRRDRLAPALETLFAAVLLARFVYWTWPALAEVRRTISPPMAAIGWIRQHVPPGSKIYVRGGMTPFTDCCLTGYVTEVAPDDFDPLTVPAEPGAYFTADFEIKAPGGVNFRREHNQLWGLFLRRYFEATVVPVAGAPDAVAGTVELGEGWHKPETDGAGKPYRWMGTRGVLRLGGLRGKGALGINFYAPIDAEAVPLVTIAFNNTVVDRFRAEEANFRKVYELESPGELVITVDRAVNPAKLGLGSDTRDLGLRVTGITWRTAAR